MQCHAVFFHLSCLPRPLSLHPPSTKHLSLSLPTSLPLYRPLLFPSPHRIPPISPQQHLNHRRPRNQQHLQPHTPRISLPRPRELRHLPDKVGRNGLHHIRKIIPGRDQQRPLLCVVGADLVDPREDQRASRAPCGGERRRRAASCVGRR
jgi:hypothetical protein